MSREPTPFEKLGREAGVRTAVDSFYARVLDDAGLVGFFDGVEIDRVKENQCAFLAAVLGGPRRYAGRPMSVAHSHRRISREAFDAVLDHLVDTLGELGVDNDIIERVVQTMASLEGEIVGA